MAYWLSREVLLGGVDGDPFLNGAGPDQKESAEPPADRRRDRRAPVGPRLRLGPFKSVPGTPSTWKTSRPKIMGHFEYGLLWGIVAYYFGLLGVPGSLQ